MTAPLDPAGDPDRYHPARDVSTGRLDPAGDPDRYDPARDTSTGRLDPAKDPDRYDPSRDASVGPLDPAKDADRFPSYGGEGQGQTLTGLLGEGAQEQKREGLAWLFGLLAVFGFLVLVSLLVKFAH